MNTNTSKTVDQVYATIRVGYQAWKDGNFPIWGATIGQALREVNLATLGLACMRAQRQTDEKTWGKFFTVLLDAIMQEVA